MKKEVREGGTTWMMEMNREKVREIERKREREGKK